MGFWSKFFGFFFRPMLYTAASDRMMTMFERGTARAVRRLSIKEHKIHDQFLEFEKSGSMKKIIKLEHPMIKTLITMLNKLYLSMHRQFILQYHLGLEINAASMAAKQANDRQGTLARIDRSKLGSILTSETTIGDGIAKLKRLKNQLNRLLDEEIRKIDREIKQGQVFLGIKKISKGGALNELIGLSRVEGRNANKLNKLVKHIRAITASAKAKEIGQLQKEMGEFYYFASKELQLMDVLFYDDLTLISYTDGDRTEMVEFLKRLEKEGFPPALVANFLNEINKELMHEKRQLAELETEARKAESELLHGKTI